MIIFRVNDTKAPDQKPKVLHSKKKKNKKKRKKRKDIANQNADVSFENIEGEIISEEKEEFRAPVELVKCEELKCDKKFTSKSALRYHVSFSHEQIIKEIEIKEETKVKVDPQQNVNLNEKCNDITTASDIEIINHQEIVKKPEPSKSKSKLFPSTQNIRPIVPVLSPEISGLSLKPIQPKPTILPEPATNFCLDVLKKINKKGQIHNIEKLPNLNADVECIEEEPTVIDLSNHKDETIKSEKKERHSQLISLLGNDRNRSQKNSEQNYEAFGNALKTHKNQYMKVNDERANIFPIQIPNPSWISSPKKNPSISVKMEFNTGHKKNLENNSEIQDFSTKPPKESTPTINQSIFPTQLGYMPHSFFSTQGLVPGLMMPPLNTNPLMLPGLMNMPQTAAPSSPFGASLESLARAAEERARNFGNFSPAHVPGGFSPAQVQAALPTVQRNCPPQTSESSEAPLLRHEHMHTHLHYITSPTHSQ